MNLPGGLPAQRRLDIINRSLLLAAAAAGGVALLLTAHAVARHRRAGRGVRSSWQCRLPSARNGRKR